MKMTERGSEAYGYKLNDGFVVKQGSRISPDVTEEFQNRLGLYGKRMFLLTDHVIEEGVFTRDYTFESAAKAASIISGTESRTEAWREERLII